MKPKDQGTMWITCSNEMYKFIEDRRKELVPGHQQEAGAHVWECEQRVSHHTRRACWRRCSPAIALIAYLWRRRQTNMSTGRGPPPRCAQITGYQHLGCIPQPRWGSWRRGRWGSSEALARSHLLFMVSKPDVRQESGTLQFQEVYKQSLKKINTVHYHVANGKSSFMST